MSRVLKILGVKIDNFSKKEILQKVESFLESESFHQIVTTNAEFILKAQEDRNFQEIINKADLSVADSISIKYAFLRHFQFLKTRMAGVDLMQEILKLAEKKKIPVFLVARKGGLSDWWETKEVILRKFSDLEIRGADLNVDDFFGELQNSKVKIPDKLFNFFLKNQIIFGNDRKKERERCFLNKNFNNKKFVVFCNFGAPEQDKFIDSLRNSGLKICLGMGVGGSFDFLTGKVKRAPKWMQFLGLEWLFRLIQQFFIKQPKNSSVQSNRFRRIFKAVIIFPIRVILNK